MAKPDLLILGSAAAEAIPAYFCECRVCREAAALGGRELRHRTSYNFGGVLQIDFGPDALQGMWAHRGRLHRMRHLLVTHAHEDHFAPEELLYHGAGFCGTPTETLTIHGTRPTWERLRSELAPTDPCSFEERFKGSRIAFHEFKRLDDFEIPDIGARVRAFPADHAEELEAVVFLITMGGRTVFIGNDTGYLREPSWEALAKLRGEVAIDVAVLDNTGMLQGVPGGAGCVWDRGHMSAPTVLRTFERLGELGLLAPDCVRAVNHFSHNGGSTTAEMEAFYGPRGILVGYDGLVL